MRFPNNDASVARSVGKLSRNEHMRLNIPLVCSAFQTVSKEIFSFWHHKGN